MKRIIFLFLVALSLAVAYDSSYNQEKSLRYVDFAGAAYCADPLWGDNTINSWACKVCEDYPGVQATAFHGSKSDANGFVAYDPAANEIVVSFSGTDPLSIRNWIEDLNFIKTSYPYCSGCEVHQGFYNTFTSVASTVLNLTQTLRTSYPSASISITGHSLGAALAAHCAAEFTHQNIPFLTLYTYGMPRVGNEAFEKWYTTAVPGTFRVVHRKDPVPQLPPQNWGFHHMPYEIFYVKDYNEWVLCSVDGEDENCSDQYHVDLDVCKYTYFRVLFMCSSESFELFGFRLHEKLVLV